MRKIWAIVRREFVERVRTRWFWVGALLGPMLFGVVFFLSGQLGRGGGLKRIAVVDATATQVGARIAEQLGRSGNWATEVPAAPRAIVLARLLHGDHPLHGDPAVRHQRDELGARGEDDPHRRGAGVVAASLPAAAR